MLKNLKALVPKQWQENKKNKAPPRPKSKPKITALRRIRETMGNLASSMLQSQHFIENIDEHATKIMEKLDRMRHDGNLCDLTIKASDGSITKAHKVVASFNEKLLEIILESCDVDVATANCDVNSEIGGKDESSTNGTAAENSDATTADCDVNNGCQNESLTNGTTAEEEDDGTEKSLTSATSEGDLVKGLNDDDVITKVTECSKEAEDSKESESEKDCDLKYAIENDCDITDVSVTDDGEVTNDETFNEEDRPKSQETIETELPPPLVEELSSDPVGDNNETVQNSDLNEISEAPPNIDMVDRCDITIEVDDITHNTSYEDPVVILVNFLYTSHINITSRNVDKLRILAKQCGIVDVTMACDAFDSVLQSEMELGSNSEEKEKDVSNFRYQYSDPQMSVKMLEHFDKLRHNSSHVDVTIRSPSTSFKYKAHSAILSASTEFFSDAIISAEKSDDITKRTLRYEIEAPDAKDSMLNGVLTYLYTGKVPISSSSVKPLLETASNLGLDDVMQGCTEYMESIVSPQTAIDFYHLADKYQCEKLKTISLKYTERNFLSAIKSPDFLTVSKEWLRDILSSDTILYDKPASEGEYQIFEAVRKWVNYDLENRKKVIYEVMSEVRIPLIKDSHLVNDVSTDLLVMEDDNLCERVTKTITGKLSCKFPESISMRGKEHILLVGGSVPIDDETSDDQGYTAVAFSDHVTLFDIRTGSLTSLSTLRETRSLHCAIAMDHYLVIAGGYDKYSCITNDVMCFDLANLSWSDLPPMKVKRSCFVLQNAGDYIYAVGGLTPTGYSAKVERYDRDKMKWEFVSSMPETFYRHSSCVYHDQIVVSGGNDKATDALTYIPTEDLWRHLKPMNHGRDSHAMVTVLDKVYVVGGDIKLFSIEEYNSSSECWQVLAEPFNERIYLSGAAVLDNKIFLIGGWREDDDARDDIKCFDPTTERWLPITTHLPFPRGSLTATVIRVPKSYL